MSRAGGNRNAGSAAFLAQSSCAHKKAEGRSAPVGESLKVTVTSNVSSLNRIGSLQRKHSSSVGNFGILGIVMPAG